MQALLFIGLFSLLFRMKKSEVSLVSGDQLANKRKNNLLLAVVSVLIIFGAIVLSMSQFLLPRPLTADADVKEFSAERAYGYLERFATEPRYTGTKNHDAARDVLVQQIKDLGIEPKMQNARILNGSTYGAIQNIIFQVDGSTGGKTILLIGHYDTVPGSSGAADDGLSVACMLESARALMEADRIKNTIVFLLTDEEQEMLGARAFADAYARAYGIDMVINFDNRGNKGMPILYQTNGPNAWLAGHYANAVPCPIGSSLLADVYKLMPNRTDFSVYSSQGFPGYNIAMAEGMNTYHNSSDNIKTVSIPSIQQFGDNMLSFIRYFGNLAQWDTGSGDAVFFSLFRSVMVAYPAWVSYPLLGAVLALFLYTLISGTKKKILSAKGILLGAGICGAVLIAGYFAGAGVFNLCCAQNPYANWYLSNNDLTFAIPCLIGLIFILFSLSFLIFWLAKKRIKTYDLLFGGYFIWMALAAVTTLLLPGGSYLFAWSLLFALTGFNLMARKNNPLIGISFSLPAILLSLPVILFIFHMLTLSNGGILSVAVALLMILFVPFIKQLTKRTAVLVCLAAAIAGIAATTVIALNIHPSAQNPIGTEVNYVLDKDRNDARIVSVYKPYGYSSQYVSGDDAYGSVDVPIYGKDVYYSEAPVVQMAEPLMSVVSDVQLGGKRTLELKVQSRRKADLIYLQIQDPVTIHRVVVNGSVQKDKTARYDATTSKFYLILVNTKDTGNDVVITTDGNGPLTFKVLDISFRLPDSILAGKQPSGADNANYGDKTIVMKKYAF